VHHFCVLTFYSLLQSTFSKDENSEDESNDSEEAGSDDKDATVGSLDSLE
jgi:hypothetical protein